MFIGICAIFLINEACLSQPREYVIGEVLPFILIFVKLTIFNNACIIYVEGKEAGDKPILFLSRIFLIEELYFAFLYEVELKAKFKGYASIFGCSISALQSITASGGCARLAISCDPLVPRVLIASPLHPCHFLERVSLLDCLSPLSKLPINREPATI